MPRPSCSVADCSRAAVGRGMCTVHYGRWRRVADPQEFRPPDGALLAAEVAAVLGYSTGSFKNQANAGRYPPDGRTVSGRAWWHPETAQRYRREQRPAGTISAREVADLLDVPIRAVYRLKLLPATSRATGRPWWALKDVFAYQRALPPADAVTVNELARTLQVTTARVRALARTEWPADGRDAAGRLWWNRERLDELLGPRRRCALE